MTKKLISAPEAWKWIRFTARGFWRFRTWWTRQGILSNRIGTFGNTIRERATRMIASIPLRLALDVKCKVDDLGRFWAFSPTLPLWSILRFGQNGINRRFRPDWPNLQIWRFRAQSGKSSTSGTDSCREWRSRLKVENLAGDEHFAANGGLGSDFGSF